MDNSFIKLYRKIDDWEWYKDIPTKVLFFHLLIKVNFTEKKWQGRDIKKWEIITSLDRLSHETGLTVMQVRTALNKLKSTHEITSQSTSTFTHIQLTKWEQYQGNITSQITNEQQTDNKPITTTKEGNNERKKEIDTIVSKDITKTDNRNQDIQTLIYHIKEFCTSHSIIYDSTDDRNFARHIMTAKEFWDIADSIGKNRIETAIAIMELAEMDKFWRGKVCWPKSIYQNRAKILNNGRATYINQTQNPDVLVI